MGIRSLVSFGLFVLPIAVTLGILLAIDLPRHSKGQKSIFTPPPLTKITTDTFCQLAYGFTPDPGRFTCMSLSPSKTFVVPMSRRCRVTADLCWGPGRHRHLPYA